MVHARAWHVVRTPIPSSALYVCGASPALPDCEMLYIMGCALHGVGCTPCGMLSCSFAAVLADGRPTGEAFVMFASAADAKLACVKDR
jgi:hypothetical protein